MALKIRMSRRGAKKRPFYHIVVAESSSPRDGRYVERLGFFDPMTPKDSSRRLSVDLERAKYWLGVGALPSDRIHRIFASLDIMEPRQIPNQTKKSAPKARAVERAQEQAGGKVNAEAAVKEAAELAIKKKAKETAAPAKATAEG